MRDLADDLRDYFDALADPPTALPEPQTPHRRWPLVLAVAVAVVAAVTIAAVSRPRPQPAPVVAPPAIPTAVAERDGLRLTLRLLSVDSGTYTVETEIQNVGKAPIRMGGQLEPDACHQFPVVVEAVRTAWAPGDELWPGADHYLGPIRGEGWSNIESRGSSFTDPRLEEAKQAVLDRTGYLACSLVGESGSLEPGQRAVRTFTWTPPAGWPGGRHELVARYFLGYERVWHPVTVAARLRVDVHTDVSDSMGPAQALDRLAHEPAFQSTTSEHGGLRGVTSKWSPATWTISVQYMDSQTAFWMVDAQGAVTRKD